MQLILKYYFVILDELKLDWRLFKSNIRRDLGNTYLYDQNEIVHRNKFNQDYIPISTAKNIVAFAINKAVIKPQLTDIKFSLHRDPKIKAGRQNVPINVPIPLASIAVSTLNL